MKIQARRRVFSQKRNESVIITPEENIGLFQRKRRVGIFSIGAHSSSISLSRFSRKKKPACDLNSSPIINAAPAEAKLQTAQKKEDSILMLIENDELDGPLPGDLEDWSFSEHSQLSSLSD